MPDERMPDRVTVVLGLGEFKIGDGLGVTTDPQRISDLKHEEKEGCCYVDEFIRADLHDAEVAELKGVIALREDMCASYANILSNHSDCDPKLRGRCEELYAALAKERERWARVRSGIEAILAQAKAKPTVTADGALHDALDILDAEGEV